MTADMNHINFWRYKHRMNHSEVLKNARANLNGSCKVCPVCNGRACPGEIPGMGGKGTGESFFENVESLKRYKLNMRVLHSCKDPDTSVELFGKRMRIPVFAAPVAGTSFNMGGKFTEEEYISWITKGCLEGGIYPMIGDGAQDPLFMINLRELQNSGGNGIPIIKPWENERIIEKIRMSEAAGVFAVGMDVDAAGLITLALHGKPVGPKTVEDIRQIVESTELPLILKGIMTREDAELAVESGAAAIVVSNHGGRALDHTPGVADVLQGITSKVKGKIVVLADGGVRSGTDVLKMLALGADGVLIGRPFVPAAFGGQCEGVKAYIDNIAADLKSAMILTGCNSIAEISDRVLYK